jgi:hypothetical protein
MSTGEPYVPPEALPSVDLGPIGPKERYEFTPVQEAVIGDLAGKMRFVGAFLLALTILGIAEVIFELMLIGKVHINAAISVLIYGLVGYWTLSASGAFAAVVSTTGWDVPHLMDALRSLRKMYSLLFTLLIAAFVATLILMIATQLR